MPQLLINPPLLNSSNPWCTTLEQLRELYECPHTGAVSTRTSLLAGFPTDPSIHQYAFFNASTHKTTPPNPSSSSAEETGSLNTLGYSPLPLQDYLGFIKTISDELPVSASYRPKPFVISITGTVEEVVQCYRLISEHQRNVRMPLAMEINLSCPNIPDKPPPAYESAALLSYLSGLNSEIVSQRAGFSDANQFEVSAVKVGIKTPPYTYHDQFKQMIDALVTSAKEVESQGLRCPISFITATNTLGSSLLLQEVPEEPLSGHPLKVEHHAINSVNGTGIGGMAGAPLHPLSLGNVYTIKGMLFQHDELQHIQIIGVGGVDDFEGFKRMRAVGAAAVGVGTALGRKGIKVFEEIAR